MVKIALLGIPHDDNSSFMKGRMGSLVAIVAAKLLKEIGGTMVKTHADDGA